MSVVVQDSLRDSLNRYAVSLREKGIHPEKFVLFGSYARGEEHQWSDIDLVVVAPELDLPREHEVVSRLWYAVIDVDSRIEPIPCGVHEWEDGCDRMIIDVARAEGVEIDVSAT